MKRKGALDKTEIDRLTSEIEEWQRLLINIESAADAIALSPDTVNPG